MLQSTLFRTAASAGRRAAAVRPFSRSAIASSSRPATRPTLRQPRFGFAAQAVRLYSAGGALKKEDVEGRIMELLKGFDKVRTSFLVVYCLQLRHYYFILKTTNRYSRPLSAHCKNSVPGKTGEYTASRFCVCSLGYPVLANDLLHLTGDRYVEGKSLLRVPGRRCSPPARADNHHLDQADGAFCQRPWPGQPRYGGGCDGD
jgi:hypothetical protein